MRHGGGTVGYIIMERKITVHQHMKKLYLHLPVQFEQEHLIIPIVSFSIGQVVRELTHSLMAESRQDKTASQETSPMLDGICA